jgi:hypothetical protein
MSNDHVHPTFQSLLSDIREATHTLQRCAVKGAAMPIRDMEIRAPVRRYDPKCEDLAAAFLVDHPPFSRFEKEDLAQAIQDVVEDWLADRESRALEDK